MDYIYIMYINIISLFMYIYIQLKVVGCSTISIFRQQAAFVRNVKIDYLNVPPLPSLHVDFSRHVVT